MYPTDEVAVVFDQMESEITSRKNDQGIILDVSKGEISTSPFFDRYSHSEVRFEQSCNSNFLALADTIAYNVYRQFVMHGDQWGRDKDGDIELYEYFKKITGCMYTSVNGTVSGYGVIKVPNVANKKVWTQKKTSDK